MTELTFKDIYDPEIAKDAIINDRMEGFREDYLVLHCLLRKYKIKSCFEIGTHTGFGTKIIKNAVGENAEVYSLDLPDSKFFMSLQHPLSEGKKGVGFECDLPFTSLRGDSRWFDYWMYPCEAYYIDGEHTKEHVKYEVNMAALCGATLIILHDADMPEVQAGLAEAWTLINGYNSYRVIDTRIAYLIKNRHDIK